MKKKFIVIYILGLFSVDVSSQQKTKYPNVGDTLPDHTFADIENYPKSAVKISDFRGKWLILDFWGYTCSACIASFPKMNKLSHDFKDSIQLIMVGATKNGWGDTKQNEKITKNLYKRLEKTYQLDFTVAFDSVLYLKHDVGPLPHILIIDPNGIIKAKAQHIDSIQLSKFLTGKIPEFERSYSRSEPMGGDSFRKNLPVLTNGKQANGGNDTSFVFRSLLALPNENMPYYNLLDLNRTTTVREIIKSGRLELYQQPLKELYRFAFFGVNYWDVFNQDYYSTISLPIIVEQKDSSNTFKIDTINRYTYSLTLPRERLSKETMMHSLQADLERYFGYNARIEDRKMPVLFAEIADKRKIEKLITRTNGQKFQSSNYEAIYKVRNIEFSIFLRNISAMLHSEIPIIDQTNIKESINIDFKADLFNPDDIKKSLGNYGIKLVEGFKEMKVIVVTN